MENVTLHAGSPKYPGILRCDPRPPDTLYLAGRVDLLGRRPSVGIVGTRRCTHYGREVAFQFGRELSESGVHVLSGLAIGIDGAAHEGSLSALSADSGAARPVGVVGSGLDVVYPRRNSGLWQRMIDEGLLISEAPAGTAPEPWRFPLRNRIIAALSDVLVVIESAVTGGSRHTVDAAIERGVPVMAVPGSIRSNASAGTNQLLSEGCAPACSTADILTALSLESAPRPEISPRPEAPQCDEVEDQELLSAVDWTCTPLEFVARRLNRPIDSVAADLYRLSSDDKVATLPGGWVRLR